MGKLSDDEVFELCEHLREELEPAPRSNSWGRSKSGFICPKCGSGTGIHGTGGVGYYRHRRDGKLMWKCFSCGAFGDIFNFVMYKYQLNDANEAMKFIRQKYYDESGVQKVQEPKPKLKRSPSNVLPKNYTAYLTDCIDRLNIDGQEMNEGASYLRNARHLSVETIKHFMLGYDDSFVWYDRDTGASRCRPAITIPYPGTHGRYFIRRFIDGEKPKYLKLARTEEPIYDECAANNTTSPVFPEATFIVEGQFDAMAIWQAAHEQDVIAIALGGQEGNRLIACLEDGTIYSNPGDTFIVALDDEDNPNTRANRDRLIDQLKSIGLNAVACEGLYLGKKDANEALCYDESAFANRLTEAIMQARQGA